jgi:hypothetical protein
MTGQPDFNNRLRTAVKSVAAPPYLEARIRANVQATDRRRSWTFRLVPAAAAAAICLAVLIAYQLGHLRLTTRSQERYIASVSYRVGTIMRVGLGDHIHCSVFRKYPKNPPPVQKLEQDLGPEYQALLPIVQTHVPDDYRLMMGHQCRYHGRRFVHFSFMSDAHLVSLVIARKQEGESFNTEGLLPALVQSGIPVYQAGVQRFAMTSFESRDFLVYVVSDLPQQQNTEMMIAMAPSVKGYLAKLEL